MALSQPVDLPRISFRQRILQRHHKRMSIRLEEVFWTQLEACAKEENVRLAELVFSLVEGRDKPANRSSLLRSYCVDWLRKRLVQARLTSAQIDIQGILMACPIPCVVITPQRGLAAQNPAFRTEVVSRLLPPGQAGSPESVIRLTLSQPYQAIFDKIRTSAAGFVEAPLSVSSATASVNFLGSFCLVSRRPAEASPLLCFLRVQP